MAKLIIEIDGTGAKRTAADLEAALKRLGINARQLEGDTNVASRGLDRMGGSAQRLKGWIASIITVTAAIQFGKKILAETMESERAVARLDAVLSATGGRAGVTRQRMIELSQEIQRSTALGDEAILDAETTLLRFSRIRGEVLERALRASADAAAMTGQTVEAMAQGIGRALEIPGEGMRALAQVGVVLTESEQKAIDKLLELGKTAEAQAFLLDKVEGSTKGAAAAMRDSLPGAISALKNAWGDLLEMIGSSDIGVSLRQGVEGAIKTIRWLTDNWRAGLAGMYQFAADTFETIGNLIADSVTGWAMIFASLAVQLAKVNFLPGADETRKKLLSVSGELYSFGKVVRETANDLAIGYGEKAQNELTAWVAEADKAAVSTGKFTGRIVELGEALKFPKKLEHFFPAAGVNIGVTDADIRNLERAAQLTAQVLTESERHSATILEAKRLYETINELTGKRLISEETYRRVLEANRDTFVVIAEEASQWAETMRQIGENFTRGVQDAFADFFTQIFTTGKVGWKDLLDTIWKLFAQMLAKMVTEWIIKETKETAETIRQAAIRRAANSQSSGGGGASGSGGGAGGLAGMFGGGGGGGGSSAGAIGGWITILFALYVVYKGFIESHDFKFSEASFGGETSGSVERWGKGLQDAVRAAKKVITDFAAEMHLGSVDLAAASGIIIGRSADNTYYVRGALYSIERGFKTIEEAMEYAAVAAMKMAEYGKEVSEFIRAAIRNSAAETLQDLRSDIEFARRLESAGKPDFFAGMLDAWNQFLDDWKRAVDLFLKSLDQLPVALNAVGLNLVTSLRDTYNQLTGYKPTRAELLADAQMRATMFNAQRALTLAELRLRAMEIEQRIALLQNLAGIIGGGNGGVRPPGDNPGDGSPRGDRGKSLLEVQMQLWQLELEGKAAFLNAQGQLLKIDVEQRNALLMALQAQLDALLAIIGQIELIPEIKPEDIKLPGRGGGRSRADRLREQADLREQASLFGASDVKQQLYDAAHSLDDYIERVKKAGFSQAETARLIAAATEEERRRQQVIADGIKRSADEFVRRGMSPATADLAGQFAGIDAEAANLIGGLRALRQAHKITTAELIRRMQEIADASEAMKRAIAMDTFLNLAQRMAEAAGNSEAALKIEKLRWELEKANMKVQIEFLRASGLISEANLKLLDDLYEGIRGLDLPVGGGADNPYLPGNRRPQVDATIAATQDNIEALRRLTAAIDKLREFDEGLLLSNQSPLTTQQRFSEAQRQFADIASRAQSSDVAVRTAAIEALPEIERTLLEVAAAMFGTSGAGYATIFDQIRALNAIITGGTFTPVSASSAGNVVNAQGSFGGGGSTATAGGVAATNVYMNTAAIETKLDRIGDGVDGLREEFNGLLTDVRRAGSLAG